MKKTRSLHLEEDIWAEIDQYKEHYNLSSRNVALERMLLERRFLINENHNFINTHNLEVKKKSEIKQDTKETDKELDRMMDDMPE